MTQTEIRQELQDGFSQLEFSEKATGSIAVKKTKLEHAVVKGTPLLLAGAIATGCVFVAINDPESQPLGPACGFYAVTGLYCPGCGMTRAVGNLVQGDLVRAFRFNALLMISLPIFIYLYVWWVTWAFADKQLPVLRFTKPMIIIAIVFTVVFAVGRNFPGEIPAFFSLGRV